MSQQDFWTVVERAKTDRDFATQLFQDPEGTLRAQGLSLTPAELQAALSPQPGQTPPNATRFNKPGGAPWQNGQPSNMAMDPALLKMQQEEMAKIMCAQSERMIDLGKFTAKTLKDTIEHATGTYKKITMMNQMLFWLGMALFVFAVGYAVYSHNLKYSIAFAGLGTASFIGTFLLGPLGATQGALSDLISAEIAFMSYFEQIFLIEAIARDPARVERASELMHLRSVQMADLLHRYLDNRDKHKTGVLADSIAAEAAHAKQALGHL